MNQEEFNRISKRIQALRSESIELMKAIVAIKALGPSSGGEGEAEKAEFIKKYLNAIGIRDVAEFPAPDNRVPGGMRPNLVAQLPGRRTDRTLWILAHFDVVPEGDLSRWQTDPYEAVVKEGRIYGRGTEDNHQGLVGSIIAARAFLEERIIPAINIGLVFVSDEETGSAYGLAHLLHNHSELFNAGDLIIVPDAGEPDGSMIEVAEKSIMWIKFKTLGKQVHASMPHRGVNAFRAASFLATSLDGLYELYPARDEVFDPPMSTFEPTKKEANVPNVNTIPGDDVFYLDCRVLPQYNIEDVLNNIRKICNETEKKFGVKIEISFEQKDQAAPATPVDAPVVQALKQAIRDVYRIEARAMGIGGGTVAAIFRRAGLDAAVWSTLDDTAHQPDEYCVIDNLLRDAEVFAHVSFAE
jgi:succinyl-diaminopimelate desuccinylase